MLSTQTFSFLGSVNPVFQLHADPTVGLLVQRPDRTANGNGASLTIRAGGSFGVGYTPGSLILGDIVLNSSVSISPAFSQVLYSSRFYPSIGFPAGPHHCYCGHRGHIEFG